MTTVAPLYEGRDGGYTRIVKLDKHRLGDGTDLVLLQLVGQEDGPQVGGGAPALVVRLLISDRVSQKVLDFPLLQQQWRSKTLPAEANAAEQTPETGEGEASTESNAAPEQSPKQMVARRRPLRVDP